MRIILAALIALLTLAAADDASAQRSRTQASGMDWDTGQFRAETYPQTRSYRSSNRGTRSARSARRGREDGGFNLSSLSGGYNVGPRPRAWCGWWMRTQLGGGPEYNLAWNWRKYGSAASPQVGAVVVWRNHVGMIVGEAGNGKWLVKSGNWGGRVATVARSIRGAVVRI